MPSVHLKFVCLLARKASQTSQSKLCLHCSYKVCREQWISLENTSFYLKNSFLLQVSPAFSTSQTRGSCPEDCGCSQSWQGLSLPALDYACPRYPKKVKNRKPSLHFFFVLFLAFVTIIVSCLTFFPRFFFFYVLFYSFMPQAALEEIHKFSGSYTCMNTFKGRTWTWFAHNPRATSTALRCNEGNMDLKTSGSAGGLW